MVNHQFHGRGCGSRDGMRGGGRRSRGSFGFGFEGRSSRGGHRGGRMFDSSELRLVLLDLIAAEPRHGYDLIRRVEELTGGAYAPSPGIVYPTLTLLDEMGQIEEQASEGAKKRFAITEDGRKHLEENREQVDAIMARLRELGAEREKTDGAPIRRAMGNLGQALHHRLTREGVTSDTLHDVAELIDAVAQKIERL